VTIYPVIMAGGSGTRFWPLSRANRPKQFLPLAGPEPLLTATVARLPPLARLDRTYVVCGPNHEATVRKLVPRLPRQNLLVEPCPRNTAPAWAWPPSTWRAATRAASWSCSPPTTTWRTRRPFRDALSEAGRLAAQGAIATIGIRPSRPETGYGYLRLGARLPGGRGKARQAWRVERFVEKPDVITAARYLAEGATSGTAASSPSAPT